LRAALAAWSDQAYELLDLLDQQGKDLNKNRSPQQIMALGTFRAHLIMGLKALRFAEQQ
tara:strand:+ start:11248 stop:11424 length:177 start_codon:yes stop_codon:yes gene_type:complete